MHLPFVGHQQRKTLCCYPAGPLPVGLSSLTSLSVVLLGDNTLTGVLPPEYAAMAGLLEFRAEGNRLLGPLPQAWAQANALQVSATAICTYTTLFTMCVIVGVWGYANRVTAALLPPPAAVRSLTCLETA